MYVCVCVCVCVVVVVVVVVVIVVVSKEHFLDSVGLDGIQSNIARITLQ